MNNIIIKNINKAKWFISMIHYPETIQDMKLLLSIIDKLALFKNYDISKINSMDANKLNVLYAILRITNKIFCEYLDYSVKKIFIDGLKEIFECTDFTYYDLFFDQLTQDIYDFSSWNIETYYLEIDETIIKDNFVNYLQVIFKKSFYTTVIKKLSYDIDKKFFIEHNDFFVSLVHDFCEYTKKTLYDTYQTMKIFLDKIFLTKCSTETVNEIIKSLQKHINLKILFMEPCVELEIFYEQKLANEI